MKHTKFVAVFLAILLTLSVFPTVSARSFSDVPSSMPGEYRNAINYVTDNGIMNGADTNLFSPERGITRGMIVTVLYRLSGESGTYTNANKFVDVPQSTYYYNAIGRAVAKGITNGISETEFGPETTIKRRL